MYDLVAWIKAGGKKGAIRTLVPTIRSVAPPLSTLVRRLFPFLFIPPRLAKARPNYRKRGDHCFLPAHLTCRKQVHFETLSLALTLIALFVAAASGAALLFGITPLVVISFVITLFYLIILLFKIRVVTRALQFPYIDFSPRHIAALCEQDLPAYTVLVPLRDEAEVMEQIVEALERIEYPADKLDLIITVEEYDDATRAAIERVGLPANWRVVVLPDTQPKTKPKALNVAFLHARGEYLVIYDAEIVPDADQLKKAVLAFWHHPEIACFQTRLEHYNTHQNVLTRLFNTEYCFYYDLFLPGLQQYQFPIPLSGHSTHFRMQALNKIGAWDPYNVAEDCEVGTRLFRAGYRTGIINSISREEAASTLMSWIKQRTRWMKGFIQTSLVHLRYPRETVRSMGGLRNAAAFLLAVPGTVLLNVLNLGTWLLLLMWFATEAEFIHSMYPPVIYYFASISFLAGGFVFIYLNLLALYRRRKFDLIKYWFLTPLYWLLLAYATARAVVQMVGKPHVWEKTTHGTHLSR